MPVNYYVGKTEDELLVMLDALQKRATTGFVSQTSAAGLQQIRSSRTAAPSPSRFAPCFTRSGGSTRRTTTTPTPSAFAARGQTTPRQPRSPSTTNDAQIHHRRQGHRIGRGASTPTPCGTQYFVRG